ncbi:hypothetical protein HYC85_031916 [Camellia sinensis]|uniref:Major facilitator superfamily (MFS) profile domain-containing protein n=1 Tax=Camellia sinensis TaxID=4442 RepID=A0A7J7FRS3_CAMSI|nr:hypothetical protein HYC85_031916 [Camellia sinensis]
MWMTKFPKCYVIVVLTFICTCVCYIERVGFSIAYTIAADAAGVNQSNKGTILSAFYYGYASSQVPGGWIAQKIGGRRVLLLSFVLWTLTCALVPLDPNRVIILVMARLLVGVAQGFIFPSIHNVLAQWIPPHERSRSVSCTTSGMYLGAALGMLVLPILVEFWGAQSVFHVESALGTMWCWNNLMLASIALMVLPHFRTSDGAVYCSSVALGSLALARVGFAINHMDIAPRYAGIVIGVSNTAGTLAGVIGVDLTGKLLEAAETAHLGLSNSKVETSVLHPRVALHL